MTNPTDGSASHPYLFKTFGRLGEPPLPLSQAEDSTQTSGSEPRMPGTARPRVRTRDKRPGFQHVTRYHHG